MKFKLPLLLLSATFATNVSASPWQFDGTFLSSNALENNARISIFFDPTNGTLYTSLTDLDDSLNLCRRDYSKKLEIGAYKEVDAGLTKINQEYVRMVAVCNAVPNGSWDNLKWNMELQPETLAGVTHVLSEFISSKKVTFELDSRFGGRYAIGANYTFDAMGFTSKFSPMLEDAQKRKKAL